MNEIIARGDGAGAVKHFMKNGVGIPGFAVLMMQVMGVMKKLAPVGPTLAYDTALIEPFWKNAPLPKGVWPNVKMPVLDIGGGKSDAWMQNAQVAISKALCPQRLPQDAGPGQNHMVSPDAIAPLIKEFLSRHEQAALHHHRSSAAGKNVTGIVVPDAVVADPRWRQEVGGRRHRQTAITYRKTRSP